MIEPLLPGTVRRLVVDLASTQSRGRLPSVAAGVVRDGGLVWTGARGRTVGLGTDARPDADLQYKIGSVTKTMTAALVMLARQRGELSLSDLAGRFVPRGPFADATLRELLSHSSGISAEPAGSWWERSPGVDREALAAAHQGAERVFEPGGRFHYSNLGYGVLGQVAESLAGGSWFQMLHEQVLVPLGLTRTSYEGEAPHADGFAVHHLTGELTVEPLPDTGAMAPAGQLWSTVRDMGTWMTALVDPERSVLSAESLVEMRTPQSGSPEDRAGSTYGLGLQVLTRRGRVLVGHSGSMPGFCCGIEVDVDSRVGAVVLTNGAYGLDDLPVRMVHRVLDEEPPLAEEWSPSTDVSEDLRTLVGLWYWGQAPSLLRVEGDGFAIGPVGGPGRAMAFRRVRGDAYLGTRGYLAGESLQVVRRADGGVSHLEVATFVYTREPYDPGAPIPGGHPLPLR